MKKILIIYTKQGRGHIVAAQALAEKFTSKNTKALAIDLFDFTNFLNRKIFVDGYFFISSKIPEFYRWLYFHVNTSDQRSFIERLLQFAMESKILPFIKKFDPDLIICTNPLPAQLISHFKKKGLYKKSMATIVTDYGCHALWVSECNDIYFVASQESKMCLIGSGAQSKQIHTTGIPIESKFSARLSVTQIRKEVGMLKDKKTLLVVGGQLPYKTLFSLVKSLSTKVSNLQIIIVAGRDKKLERNLMKSNLQNKKNVKVFGFVNNLHELMSISDLILTKAGGLTVSECLAKGLPMAFYKVIPGQEEDNVQFSIVHKAGIQGSDVSDLTKKLVVLLTKKNELLKYQRNAKKLGRPQAADTIKKLVIKKFSL